MGFLKHNEMLWNITEKGGRIDQCGFMIHRDWLIFTRVSDMVENIKSNKCSSAMSSSILGRVMVWCYHVSSYVVLSIEISDDMNSCLVGKTTLNNQTNNDPVLWSLMQQIDKSKIILLIHHDTVRDHTMKHACWSTLNDVITFLVKWVRCLFSKKPIRLSYSLEN